MHSQSSHQVGVLVEYSVTHNISERETEDVCNSTVLEISDSVSIAVAIIVTY